MSAEQPRASKAPLLSRRHLLMAGGLGVLTSFLGSDAPFDEIQQLARTMILRDAYLTSPRVTLDQTAAKENSRMDLPEKADVAIAITHGGFIEWQLQYLRDQLRGYGRAYNSFEANEIRAEIGNAEDPFYLDYCQIATDPAYRQHIKAIARLVGSPLQHTARIQYVDTDCPIDSISTFDPRDYTSPLPEDVVRESAPDMHPLSDTWVLQTEYAEGALSQHALVNTGSNGQMLPSTLRYGQQNDRFFVRLQESGIRRVYVAGEFSYNSDRKPACLGVSAMNLINLGFDVRGVREAIYPHDPPSFKVWDTGETRLYRALYDDAVSIEEVMD